MINETIKWAVTLFANMLLLILQLIEVELVDMCSRPNALLVEGHLVAHLKVFRVFPVSSG